ncbi:MAG: potassium-transporting ATPase subunit KdpC [Candidatus Eisenbacteria bacterium]
MRDSLRPAVVLLALFTLLTGALYPALVTAIAQAAFPWQANGSVLLVQGEPRGSALIGQEFQGAEWFWGRLSATAPIPYNAAASSGSNLGPLHPALSTAARARIAALVAAGEPGGDVPLDLVTASGSGLDPDISPAAARWQVARVARARGLAPQLVADLVSAHVRERTFGVWGEPRVNVLELNLALAGFTPERAAR